VLVRTDIRSIAGNTGEYNAMLTEAAAIRVDLPAASTAQVVAALLDALAQVGDRQ
jgi:hypothetical protein